MSKVNWSKAPEGAEYYGLSKSPVPKDAFFKFIGNELHWFHDGGWKRYNSATYFDQSQEFVATLMPRQSPEWPSNDQCQSFEHHDPVNKPKHYAIAPDVEAIDIIRSALTPEQFKGYLLGNFLKYRLRAGDKGDLQQDIDKSNWYKRELNK